MLLPVGGRRRRHASGEGKGLWGSKLRDQERDG
jgi:hypothetical protein